MDIVKMIALYNEYKDKDPIDIAKQLIDKIFAHEAKKYHCEKDNLSLVISREADGSMKIMIYSKRDNITWRVISDKEILEILMK
jgi:hypothetical protein